MIEQAGRGSVFTFKSSRSNDGENGHLSLKNTGNNQPAIKIHDPSVANVNPNDLSESKLRSSLSGLLAKSKPIYAERFSNT